VAWAIVLLGMTVAPTLAAACDDAEHTRAARAERTHRLGAAIALRTTLLTCASGARSITNELALADDHATLGDFARAAELIELAAEHAPTNPPVIAAVDQAVAYRVALRDLSLARADARWLLTATGPTAASTERAFEVGAAFESTSQWTEASQWYDELARRFPAREHCAVQVRALVGLGRAYAALGDLGNAARSWEAAQARWPIARVALGVTDRCISEHVAVPPPPTPLRTRAPRRPTYREPRIARGRFVSLGAVGGQITAGAPGLVSPYSQMIEPPTVDSRGCGGPMRGPDDPVSSFAEARLRLARIEADRCLRPLDLGPTPTTVPDFNRWVEVRYSPMIQDRQACIEAVTRRLVDVVNLRVPQWSVAGIALTGHLYATFAWAIRNAPVPPDVQRDGSLIDVWHLLR
jgi:tetratricopeptide (TPR) repeat protein